MEKVNDNMDISTISEILKEFSKNSEKMEMKQEMMGDAMDAAMDTADDVEAADKVYSQICDEIGVDLSEENPMNAGKGKLAAKESAVSKVNVYCNRKLRKTICKQDLICLKDDQEVL